MTAKAHSTAANPEGFRTPPGKLEKAMLLTGLGLYAGLLVEIAVITVFWAERGQALWKGVAVEMFLGREAGIPIALGRVDGGEGNPWWLVAQVSAVQDIGAVCIAFPAFLWLLQRFRHRKNWFMGRIRRIEAKAREHQAFARRWGPFGVFLFMLTPFLVNGPLSGAILGRLAGIPSRFLIAPVVAATVIAALAWSYFYDLALEFTAGLHPLLAPGLTIGIVGFLLLFSIVSEIRENRKKAKAAK